jgi:TPP-dependent pyruvate/acetoin dehydrogenase alpha subunit
MELVRAYERHVERLFFQGRLTGFHHQAIGAEAVCVGTAFALAPGDVLLSTHRGHGDAVAMGAALESLLAELHGYAAGSTKGRGGSMHIAAPDVGFLGVTAIVGGNLAIVDGLALAAQERGTGAIAVAAFGDGATNQGSFHESLNLASLWSLPAVFVCNNNGFAESTPRSRHQTIRRISTRARAYGMPGVTVDGRDVFAVHAAVSAAVDRARRGDGPTLVECVAPRWVGHYIGDPATSYMSDRERTRARRRDPLQASSARARELGWVTDDDLASFERDAETRVERAQSAIEGLAPADPADALGDITSADLGILE